MPGKSLIEEIERYKRVQPLQRILSWPQKFVMTRIVRKTIAGKAYESLNLQIRSSSFKVDPAQLFGLVQYRLQNAKELALIR